jgi:hypothetical protein
MNKNTQIPDNKIKDCMWFNKAQKIDHEHTQYYNPMKCDTRHYKNFTYLLRNVIYAELIPVHNKNNLCEKQLETVIDTLRFLIMRRHSDLQHLNFDIVPNKEQKPFFYIKVYDL